MAARSIIIQSADLGALDRQSYNPFATPYLAINLGATPPQNPGWLRQLPCPVLAIGPETHALAQFCDVIVPVESDLSDLITNIKSTPIAAATLVQLLRATENLPLHNALILESLAYATLQDGAENRAWLKGRPTPAAPPESDTPPIALTRENQTLTITLARPMVRNAINTALRDALCEALTLAAIDSSIHQVILQADGKCFSIGGALEEFGTASDQATAHAIRTVASPAFHLAEIAHKTRANLHGACIGAGAELASLCAHVTARQNTFLQLPEIRFGLIPGSGGTVGIPRRIGRRRAAWLMLSGRRLYAAKAKAWGLIDDIMP